MIGKATMLKCGSLNCRKKITLLASADMRTKWFSQNLVCIQSVQILDSCVSERGRDFQTFTI